MATIGTSHFVSVQAAIQYYADTEGNPEEAVRVKIAEGAIHIGKPEIEPSQRLITLDDGLRYAVVEPSTALVRPIEQWQTILADLSPQKAAARIFGDIHCFRGDVRKGFSYEKRDGYYDDVEQLARALEAWRLKDAAQSLATYVSPDDAGLPRDQFLRLVADRINDDLGHASPDPVEVGPSLAAKCAKTN